MIPTDTEAIIFDFGGVIINLDYHLTIKAFQALGISNFDEMYSQASQTNLFSDIETGRISPQKFINSLLDYLPAGTTPNQVVHAWNALLLDIPSERIELIRSLRPKYRTFMLSNTNSIHIQLALKEWNKQSDTTVYDCFDHVYFSHEVNMRKPDPEIFEFVCKEQHLDPRKTVFIDDSIQHVEGARSIGLNAIHLTEGRTIHDLFLA